MVQPRKGQARCGDTSPTYVCATVYLHRTNWPAVVVSSTLYHSNTNAIASSKHLLSLPIVGQTHHYHNILTSHYQRSCHRPAHHPGRKVGMGLLRPVFPSLEKPPTSASWALLSIPSCISFAAASAAYCSKYSCCARPGLSSPPHAIMHAMMGKGLDRIPPAALTQPMRPFGGLPAGRCGCIRCSRDII